MKIPNFHDGHFDGLWIGPSKVAHIFLRTHDGKSYTLALQGVDSLTVSDIKQGNIIFDLVFRGAQELTCADMEILYSVTVNSAEATNLVKAKSEQGLQLLEINPSYGAQGLVLFRTFEISESSPT